MGRLLDTLLSNMEHTFRHTVTTTPSGGSTGGGSSSCSSGQTQPQRLMLYSGHDSTVMPLMTGEGVLF